jgi:hypothetical protein
VGTGVGVQVGSAVGVADGVKDGAGVGVGVGCRALHAIIPLTRKRQKNVETACMNRMRIALVYQLRPRLQTGD